MLPFLFYNHPGLILMDYLIIKVKVKAMKNIDVRNIVLAFLLTVLSIQMQSCKENRDADIQTAIASETQTDPNLAGVSATVVNGVVTLTGQCADEDCRKNAEKTIKKIDGVTHVTNNIIVAPAADVTPDKDLREMAEKIVSKYKGVQAGVSNGIITLRGEVDKEKLQQLIMDLNALRHKRIDNQLAVK